MEAKEVFAELGGRAAGGGSGVVEFVHEAGGEGAEGGHLLLLEGDVLHLLETKCHIIQDGFADLRAGGHEGPEAVFIEPEEVAGGFGLEVGGAGDIGEKRNFAEGIALGDDVVGDLAAIGDDLVDADASFEEDPEMVGDFTLARDDGVCVQMNLLGTDEAVELVVLKGIEDGDAVQFLQQLRGHRMEDILLDGLGGFAHRGLGLTAF